MTVDTHVGPARRRADAEREQVTSERRAYEQFRAEVGSIQASVGRRHASEMATAGEVASTATPLQYDRPASGCRKVREAIDETIRPHSLTDRSSGDEEPLLETIRQELGDSIALVLSPDTSHRLTPQIRTAIRSKTTERIRQLDAMERTLDREAESLQSAHGDVESITDWLAAADETPLLELGFSALRQRHQTLATHRTVCETRLVDRQELLHSTTSRDGQIGLSHRSFVDYLYGDFPVTYPVLSTFTQLDSVLADCQRTVRDHLSRRV